MYFWVPLLLFQHRDMVIGRDHTQQKYFDIFRKNWSTPDPINTRFYVEVVKRKDSKYLPVHYYFPEITDTNYDLVPHFLQKYQGNNTVLSKYNNIISEVQQATYDHGSSTLYSESPGTWTKANSIKMYMENGHFTRISLAACAKLCTMFDFREFNDNSMVCRKVMYRSDLGKCKLFHRLDYRFIPNANYPNVKVYFNLYTAYFWYGFAYDQSQYPGFLLGKTEWFLKEPYPEFLIYYPSNKFLNKLDTSSPVFDANIYNDMIGDYANSVSDGKIHNITTLEECRHIAFMHNTNKQTKYLNDDTVPWAHWYFHTTGDFTCGLVHKYNIDNHLKSISSSFKRLFSPVATLLRQNNWQSFFPMYQNLPEAILTLSDNANPPTHPPTTSAPSPFPSMNPTDKPSPFPSMNPSPLPSRIPTKVPSTSQPSQQIPSNNAPSRQPTTTQPSPSKNPTQPLPSKLPTSTKQNSFPVRSTTAIPDSHNSQKLSFIDRLNLTFIIFIVAIIVTLCTATVLRN